MPDTSFFIKHEQKLEEVDFGPLINVWESDITVLVPIVVVDELDRLKHSHSYTLPSWTGCSKLRPTVPGSRPVPWYRRRWTHAQPSHHRAVLRPAGRVRLPIVDDEIIDRALAIQALADRPVTLLTYDTGQSTRARSAGLQVVKLRKNIGEEPPEASSCKRVGGRAREDQKSETFICSSSSGTS